MIKRLFFLALLSSYPFCAAAMESFVVKDIRVEGLQRTEAGTVFNYLPVRVGETMDDAKAQMAIKTLYATGFFKDVRLEQEGDVLVVTVQERPAVAELKITGTKVFTEEQLKDGLKQIGLADGRIFDRSLLDKAEQELKQQYFSAGYYNAVVTTTVTPLERNRVGIRIEVAEGDITKIRRISIIGTKKFKEKELLKQFKLTTPNLFSWFTKTDQYSKQKLAADLESLRSFYLNRGYLEFSVNSTQVSITPDNEGIYITVNITEGEKYKVSDIKLAGELLLPEKQLRKLIKLKPGLTFSRELLTESTESINARLGDEGYAFANVNAVPELDKEKHQAAFTFFIDPGRRVYVRRINITGNDRTRDEVIRREMRQMEAAWYSSKKINRSRERLGRLGYFSDINVETPAVPGTTDQVDVNFNVTEKATGSLRAGVGYSSGSGILVSGGVSQENIFGSGNSVAFEINNGEVNKVYSFSFLNPYFTDDGVSRGFSIFYRDIDSSELDVSPYKSETYGAGINFGIPINEKDTIRLALSYESSNIETFTGSSQRFKNFVAENGDTNATALGSIGWARDTRNTAIFPQKGSVQNATAEIALPLADLEYYKLSYQHQWYKTFAGEYTLKLNGEIGVGDGYGDNELPFYKNFYAGGSGSVRGYRTASLGPKDAEGGALGGDMRIVGSAEVFFPFPLIKDDKSMKTSVFFDTGQVYDSDEGDSFDLGELRYSAGVGFYWYSPFGPVSFSLAAPLNEGDDDETETFQFSFGSNF